MRGEDAQRSSSTTGATGSPPHARGRRLTPSARPMRAGITPACAGKTNTSTFPKRNCADHPRMRGEDEVRRHHTLEQVGSPPHARGRLRAVVDVLAGQRITPACAGKTTAADVAAEVMLDHPRMRGEDTWTLRHARTFRGSPPHARGRPVANAESVLSRRITPACAGKTFRDYSKPV